MEHSQRKASWGGIPLKHLSLMTLTFQNSGLILIMHYSRIMPPVEGQRYLTSTAVFLNEVIKLGLSVSMSLYDISAKLPPSTAATTMFRILSASVFSGDSWKLAIPAILYTLQNSLQYIAVSNLDAATFQVTYQLKILTTALFSIILLGRTLTARKWLSLIFLTIGVAIVQVPTKIVEPTTASLRSEIPKYYLPRTLEDLRQVGNAAAAQLMKRSATYEGIQEDVALQHPQLNSSVGLTAVIIACLLSGLAGVCFEKILKEAPGNTSVWVRNIQLSFYSLFPSFFVGVLFKDGEEISRSGFFVGYNWAVWTAIAFQAVGGIIVAFVVNYADNIAKNFATSISIIISFLASVYFFDFEISKSFLLGTLVVLFATYLYSSDEKSKSPPIRIAEYEKTTIGGSPSYFDERPASLSTPTMKNDALSTSRPGTPTVERHLYRAGSERRISAKRDN